MFGSTTTQKKKRENITDQLKTLEISEKLKSGKITEPHTNSLFVREIIGEKKKNPQSRSVWHSQ